MFHKMFHARIGGHNKEVYRENVRVEPGSGSRLRWGRVAPPEVVPGSVGGPVV